MDDNNILDTTNLDTEMRDTAHYIKQQFEAELQSSYKEILEEASNNFERKLSGIIRRYDCIDFEMRLSDMITEYDYSEFIENLSDILKNFDTSEIEERISEIVEHKVNSIFDNIIESRLDSLINEKFKNLNKTNIQMEKLLEIEKGIKALINTIQS